MKELAKDKILLKPNLPFVILCEGIDEQKFLIIPSLKHRIMNLNLVC